MVIGQASGAAQTDDRLAPTRTRWYRWRADLLGLLGVVGIVILLGHRLLGPRVSVPADIISGLSPWAGIVAPVKSHNAILHDVPLTVYPHRVFIYREIQQGHFPLWNPSSEMGQPAAGDPNMALFYPTVLALSWLSPGHALNIEMLFHLLVTALGMYVLVRVWGGGPIGALVAAAAFVACGPLTIWQQYGIGLVIQAWLPWLVVCLTLAQRGNRLVWLGVGSLFMAMMGLASSIQLTLYDLVFLGCFALFLGVQALRGKDWKGATRPVIDLAIISAIGLAIGMIQFLPFVQLALNAPRADVKGYAYIEANAGRPSQLLTLLAPNFFGTPTVGYSLFGWSLNAGGAFFAENTFFFGFFPALIALFAPIWRRTRLVWFLWGFMLAMASFVFGSFTVHLLAVLPAFDRFKPARMCYLLIFVGAALCGNAFDALFRDRRAWRPLAIIGGGGLIARGILHLALLHYRGAMNQVTTPTQESIHWVTVMVIAGIVIFAVALFRYPNVRTGAAIALLLLIVADMARFNIPYNDGVYDEDTIFPRPAVIAALPTDIAPPRVTAVNLPNSLIVFPADSLAVYRVSDMGAHDSLLTGTYLDYMGHLEQKDLANQTMVGVHTYTSPLLDLAGAEYLFSYAPLDTTGQQLDEITYAQNLYLYRNRQAAPRPFIVTNVTIAASASDVWRTLDAPGFTPCGGAVIEASRPPQPAPPAPAGCVGSATITHYEPNRVDIHATTPADGLLVLSDTYYPGWRVTVDGKMQTIYKTDGMFRGVLLPAGTHDVRFTYRPISVMIGGAITAVALPCPLALILLGKGRGKMWLRRSRART